MKIIVKDVIGVNAISMQSGKLLYDRMHDSLLKKDSVELDFNEVEIFASPFFNASIGLLLKDIKIEELQKNLKLINLSDVGRQLLNHVIANAINYYNKETRLAASLKELDDDIGKGTR
jgi:hypothetical protein